MKITKDINFNSERLFKNEPFIINYSGNLFNQGSDEVFIKFGYGESWNNITELQMNKLDSGFSVEITPTEVNLFMQTKVMVNFYLLIQNLIQNSSLSEEN